MISLQSFRGPKTTSKKVQSLALRQIICNCADLFMRQLLLREKKQTVQQETTKHHTLLHAYLLTAVNIH